MSLLCSWTKLSHNRKKTITSLYTKIVNDFTNCFGKMPHDIVLLEPHLQSILFWLFWRWGLANYLPL
jgi:hypothetical protein